MSLLVAASGVAALAMTSPAPVTPDPRPPPTAAGGFVGGLAALLEATP